MDRAWLTADAGLDRRWDGGNDAPPDRKDWLLLTFQEWVEFSGKLVDGLGVAVTVVGVAIALAVFLFRVARPQQPPVDAYRQVRRSVGRSVLLGLELLVAGDIIRTVAVSPTFASVGVLAVIVAVRTFLSFTLELELTARWPWQREPEGGA